MFLQQNGKSKMRSMKLFKKLNKRHSHGCKQSTMQERTGSFLTTRRFFMLRLFLLFIWLGFRLFLSFAHSFCVLCVIVVVTWRLRSLPFPVTPSVALYLQVSLFLFRWLIFRWWHQSRVCHFRWLLFLSHTWAQLTFSLMWRTWSSLWSGFSSTTRPWSGSWTRPASSTPIPRRAPEVATVSWFVDGIRPPLRSAAFVPSRGTQMQVGTGFKAGGVVKHSAKNRMNDV